MIRKIARLLLSVIPFIILSGLAQAEEVGTSVYSNIAKTTEQRVSEEVPPPYEKSLILRDNCGNTHFTSESTSTPIVLKQGQELILSIQKPNESWYNATVFSSIHKYTRGLFCMIQYPTWKESWNSFYEAPRLEANENLNTSDASMTYHFTAGNHPGTVFLSFKKQLFGDFPNSIEPAFKVIIE